MAAADEITLDEDQRVHAWKLCLLVNLGYDEPDALELADADADVHLLARLIQQGCAHAVAAPLAR